MNQLNTTLKVLAGTIKTYEELIMTALDARTYSADADLNASRKAQQKSWFKGGAMVAQVSMKPDVNVYSIDAFKGNRNGVIDQAAWTLPDDVTDQPGGGELCEGGVLKTFPNYFGLSSRAIYAAADAVIFFDVSMI